jgi:hypothetical protein
MDPRDPKRPNQAAPPATGPLATAPPTVRDEEVILVRDWFRNQPTMAGPHALRCSSVDRRWPWMPEESARSATCMRPTYAPVTVGSRRRIVTEASTERSEPMPDPEAQWQEHTHEAMTH